MKAPYFSLPDQDGKDHTLDDYKGKWLILFFYPKDNTPGCTKEVCSFRDISHELQEKNILIVGISKDSVSSHKKFYDKHSLSFPLLSDQSTSIIKSYGSWGIKKFMGREFEGIMRNTFLINPEGEIVKQYEKVNPLFHSNDILSDIKEIIK